MEHYVKSILTNMGKIKISQLSCDLSKLAAGSIGKWK